MSNVKKLNMKTKRKIHTEPANSRKTLCVPSTARSLSRRENSLIILRVQVPDVRILKAHDKLVWSNPSSEACHVEQNPKGWLGSCPKAP
jgi:hypothetical protein